VVLLFEPSTLELGPFLWFGGAPGEPLPSLEAYPIADGQRAALSLEHPAAAEEGSTLLPPPERPLCRAV